jgi:hypothetical protein
MAVRSRRRRRVIMIVTAVVVLVLAAVGYAWWSRRGPSAPSISKAVDQFRSATSVPTSSAALQPPPGVYIYAGSGGERLSFMATSQSQGGNLPGTVTRRANGCWTFTIVYNSFHRQSSRRCAVDGRLVERGNTTDQKFDFGPLSQSEHTVVKCDPAITLYEPAFTPGDTSPVHCTARSRTTKATMTQRGHVTFVARTTVTVGGIRVPALHYTQDLELSGDQQGTAHEDVWIAASNGLPLREERRTSVVSPAPAPLNHVTYSEDGQWLLTSLVPKT